MVVGVVVVGQTKPTGDITLQPCALPHPVPVLPTTPTMPSSNYLYLLNRLDL